MSFKFPEGHIPGDSPERERLIREAIGSHPGLDPEDAIEDFGEFNGDYSDSEHRRSDGLEGTQDEMIDAYYNSCLKQDIRIIGEES